MMDKSPISPISPIGPIGPNSPSSGYPLVISFLKSFKMYNNFFIDLWLQEADGELCVMC